VAGSPVAHWLWLKDSAVQKADFLPVELRECYLLSAVTTEMAQISTDCIQLVTSTFIRTIFLTQLLSSESVLMLLLNRLAVFNKVNLAIPFTLFVSTQSVLNPL